MKNILAHLFWFLLAVASASGADGQENLSQEAKTNFEWFSHLGFPDVQGCPYIRVATGSWSRTGEAPPQNQYVKAFLLATNSSQFTYLSMDLFKRTSTESTNGTPEHQRVGFDRLDLKREATALLDSFANGQSATVTIPELDERISKRVAMFVFAWGCWRNGLNAEAEKLYQLSKTLRYGSEQLDVDHFQLSLEQEISYAVMWRAVIDFGKVSISRAELLQEFRAIVTNYPHSGQIKRATETVEMLEKMIAEDEAHAKTTPSNLDQLPVQSRVRELIFRLRDQHGEQGGQPDWCDIFSNRQHETNTPAHQLVAIGYPAVPQLIAALEDETFTHSVGYWRNYTFSHYVLTVGDSAVAILGKITGKYFYIPNCTACYMSNEHKSSETRKLAEAWWVEFQEKGEKQMLIDGVVEGRTSATSQAELLIARYPDAAAGALVQGTLAATNPWTRTRLIQLFEKVDWPQTSTFLKGQLHEGPTQSRAAAAAILVKTDRQATIEAMIHERESSTNHETELSYRPPIARFLAGADSPEAIAALSRDLQNRPLDIRLAVVTTIGEGGTEYGEVRSVTDRSSATCFAVEQFLIAALQDEGQTHGPGFRSGKSFTDARVCDMAAFFLNQLWPKRYEFDISGSLPARDHQRIECRKIWEREHSER